MCEAWTAAPSRLTLTRDKGVMLYTITLRIVKRSKYIEKKDRNGFFHSDVNKYIFTTHCEQTMSFTTRCPIPTDPYCPWWFPYPKNCFPLRAFAFTNILSLSYKLYMLTIYLYILSSILSLRFMCILAYGTALFEPISVKSYFKTKLPEWCYRMS